MPLKNYAALPEFMAPDAIVREFKTFVDDVARDDSLGLMETADALLELITRQCNNYAHFADEHLYWIEVWVTAAWPVADADLTEALTSIVVNAWKRPRARELLEAGLEACNQRPPVRREIEEAMDEIEGDRT